MAAVLTNGKGFYAPLVYVLESEANVPRSNPGMQGKSGAGTRCFFIRPPLLGRGNPIVTQQCCASVQPLFMLTCLSKQNLFHL
jgi:hypothetical protein